MVANLRTRARNNRTIGSDSESTEGCSTRTSQTLGPFDITPVSGKLKINGTIRGISKRKAKMTGTARRSKGNEAMSRPNEGIMNWSQQNPNALRMFNNSQTTATNQNQILQQSAFNGFLGNMGGMSYTPARGKKNTKASASQARAQEEEDIEDDDEEDDEDTVDPSLSGGEQVFVNFKLCVSEPPITTDKKCYHR